jgi:protein arginine kinase activator
MMCQNCNEKEANVHITKVINGIKTEMHLCEECAKQKNEFNTGSYFGFGMPLSFQNILDGFVEAMDGTPKYIKKQETCPTCGMSFENFRETGRLGCANCYKAFEDKMTPLIRRIHGNIEHNGKIPRRTGGILKAKKSIEKMRDELKNAVNHEEYEKAAKLRDEIKELESKMNNEEK